AGELAVRVDQLGRGGGPVQLHIAHGGGQCEVRPGHRDSQVEAVGGGFQVALGVDGRNRHGVFLVSDSPARVKVPVRVTEASSDPSAGRVSVPSVAITSGAEEAQVIWEWCSPWEGRSRSLIVVSGIWIASASVFNASRRCCVLTRSLR